MISKIYACANLIGASRVMTSAIGEYRKHCTHDDGEIDAVIAGIEADLFLLAAAHSNYIDRQRQEFGLLLKGSPS